MTVDFIEPMKAKQAEDIGDYLNPEWVAEEKFDGTRYLAYISREGIHIISRRGVEKTDRLPQLVDELLQWSVDLPTLLRGTILDGEIIANGGFSETMSLVGSLGSRGVHQKVQYKYMVFDLLRASGKWIMDENLLARQTRLRQLFELSRHLPILTQSKPFTPTQERLDTIWGRGGEGIMLKRWRSTYQPGKRSGDWRKVKMVRTADGVITGFNPGEGKYIDTIGSIIISQYRGEDLRPVTNISGMTDDLRYQIGREQHRYLGQVVEFAYERVLVDSYRHPRFKRFRPDKDPKECIWND
jgi:bifunctional non-homologous end joining protein LigD